MTTPQVSLLCFLFLVYLIASLVVKANAFSVTAGISPLKLYGSQGSRSPLVSWYLYELELPFQVVSRDNSNPHPFGQIPCLVDGNTKASVFESGAILIYLANQYGTFQDEKERADMMSWCVWANASLDPVLFKENDRGQVIGTGAGQENRRLRGLDTHLGDGKNYLASSDRFTAADVAVAAYLLYVPQFFGPKASFQMYPNIAAYMKRCAMRDAYRKAYPTETDGILNIINSYC